LILVIGGRSRTGQELIRLLTAAGAELRVMTRSEDTLDLAMKDVSSVFLLCGTAHDEAAWLRNGIDAAARAGVGHVVKSSILGSSSGSPARFIRHHGDSDAHLAAAGVPYTILRPNMYMHNVTSVWPASIGEDGLYYAPAGDARISAIDARDVAAVAASVLLSPDGHLGQAYDLTGPAALSTAECCALLGAHLGRTVTYVPVDDDAAKGAMTGFGMQKWLVDALIELYQDYRRSGTDGYASAVTDSVQAITGRAPTTLDHALTADLGR
jgi:NAD(P)H dehydrogenase (quinone)